MDGQSPPLSTQPLPPARAAARGGPAAGVLLAARMAFPGAEGRDALRALRASGLFDAAHYRAGAPLLPLIARLWPERHFIAAGEGEGRSPRPGFCPRRYLALNPDLEGRITSPFGHYIAHGRAEGRPLAPASPPAALPPRLPPLPPRSGPPGAAHAAVVHVFYPDLWPELSAALRASRLPFDLHVTLAEAAEEARDTILAEWPEARIVVVPNHGRDILPFVHLVNAGWLDGYRAVLKLHTKRSPHRRDGAAWRRRLVAGLLPGEWAPALMARFLADRSASVWVADGEALCGARWWGANREGTGHLLRRLGLSPDEELRFPAGSMYWLKPHMITLIRALKLDAALFEPEAGALDGTLAHAFERAMGTLACHGGHALRTTSALRPDPAPPPPPAFVSAFYLPQFHPTEENSRNWGPGYTEWSAVARERARFPGHLQPLLPADLGFYDLRHSPMMGAQAALAAGAGIDAFCVHTYWFDGRMLLDAPLRGLLARPEIPFPFYLCWANESWRRSWDGLTGEVLVEQRYRPGFEGRLAADLAPFLRDPRHVRPDGRRLRLVIYRPAELPAPGENITRLRAALRALGLGEVEIGGVRFHLPGPNPVPPGTLDFEVEMPPHGLLRDEDFLHTGPGDRRIGFEIDPNTFRGLVFPHEALMRRALSGPDAEGPSLIAGIAPGWDTTPRRGAEGHVALAATPASFRHWLRRLRAERLEHSYRRELFINAWNEWAEGAVMEPSSLWGHAFLDALREEMCS